MERRDKDRLRMKELMEATGLPKSTILYYVAQGLLPEPVRTGRNMAYYDAASVERAKLIKKVQGTYAFPLGKIKCLLESMGEGRDISHLMELDEVVFGICRGKAGGGSRGPFSKPRASRRSRFRSFLEANLLLPLEKGAFRKEDIDAGQVFAASFAMGLRASDIAFYASIGKEMVDQEMRLRRRLTGHLPEGRDAEVTAELTRSARVLRN